MTLLYGWRVIAVWINLARVESIPLNSGRRGARCPRQQLEVMSLSSSPFVVVEVEGGVVVLEVLFFDVGELLLGFGSGGLIASKTMAWILA
uniref:Uncharacterized protein n=1 Tax=Janibacter limosus TaxID=53458 RepID=A0AC61U377_9MICO|nr:hypothetical protein [Janibacter limosus]